MLDLPDPDAVFQRFFAPWLDEEDRSRRPYAGTRPDTEPWAAPGTPAAVASPLDPEDQATVREQIEGMVSAAIEDWAELLGVTDEAPTLEWIDVFDRRYDAATVASVLAESDPSDYGNELVVLCCELGAVLGTVLIDEAPTLEWLPDWPYWESAVYDPASGRRINVFHWAIRKFSGAGVDNAMGSRLLACRDLVAAGWPADPAS